MNLHTCTIRESHAGLMNKDFSARELVDACLSRIVALDASLHAFLSIFEEAARAHADEIDAQLSRTGEIDVLGGIPCAIKDNILIQGTQTTAASRILEGYTAAYDATVIEKLKRRGAVFIGKTNLDEFAMGSSTENSAFGPTKNPWDTARVPGGSSGGSAVALAADECIAAFGSDTGGSIRQPAALCGVSGLKPTYGTVSRYGLIAMASSLDQIGPFGKTVEDVSILFDAIAGHDTRDASTVARTYTPTVQHLNESIEGMRIGVPKEYMAEGMDADVEALVRGALQEFQKQGAEVVSIELPHARFGLSVYYIIMPAEVSANLARFDGIRYGFVAPDAANLMETYTHSREQGFGAEARRRIMLGSYVLAAGYYDAYYKQAQRVRSLVKKDFDEAFRTVDCIVAPTTPTPAFLFGEKASDPLTMYLADVFTVSANIVGVPALSLPCGFVERDGKKLPVGFQLMSRHYDEATVLRIGHQYQKATSFHTEKPPF